MFQPRDNLDECRRLAVCVNYQVRRLEIITCCDEVHNLVLCADGDPVGLVTVRGASLGARLSGV